MHTDSKADSSYHMPLGFSFQLGTNSKAMEAYARLNDEEKRQVVEAARNVTIKSEVNRLVAGLERDFF